MMRVVFLLAAVTGVLCAAPTADPSREESFIALIRELETQPFFRDFAPETRVLTFEMLTAAETLNLTALLNKLGYIEVLKYIDLLPKDYSHKFIAYSIVHLEKEEAAEAAKQS